MSIIKTTPDLVPAETWLSEVAEGWNDSAVAIQTISNSQVEMFEEKLKDKLKKEGINEDWMKKHLVILSDDEE